MTDSDTLIISICRNILFCYFLTDALFHSLIARSPILSLFLDVFFTIQFNMKKATHNTRENLIVDLKIAITVLYLSAG